MALPGHIMKHRTWLSMMMILMITPNSVTSECVTVDNRICIFPFNYQNQTYAGCTGEGAPDGMLWCSTKVNSEGDHMAGVGALCSGLSFGMAKNKPRLQRVRSE